MKHCQDKQAWIAIHKTMAEQIKDLTQEEIKKIKEKDVAKSDKEKEIKK